MQIVTESSSSEGRGSVPAGTMEGGMAQSEMLHSPVVGANRVLQLLFSPGVAVEGSVVDCFGDVFYSNRFRVSQIGDGTGYFQDAVVSTCGKSQFFHGLSHQSLAVGIDGAVLVEQLGVYLSVAMDAGEIAITLFLNGSGGNYALAYLGAGLSGFLAG